MSKIKITKENDMLITVQFFNALSKELRKRGELDSDEFLKFMEKWCEEKNIECPLD